MSVSPTVSTDGVTCSRLQSQSSIYCRFTSLLLPSLSAHEHPTHFWSLAAIKKKINKMTSVHSLSGFFNTSKTFQQPWSSFLLSFHLSSLIFFMYTSTAQTHLHTATTSFKLWLSNAPTAERDFHMGEGASQTHGPISTAHPLQMQG